MKEGKSKYLVVEEKYNMLTVVSLSTLQKVGTYSQDGFRRFYKNQNKKDFLNVGKVPFFHYFYARGYHFNYDVFYDKERDVLIKLESENVIKIKEQRNKPICVKLENGTLYIDDKKVLSNCGKRITGAYWDTGLGRFVVLLNCETYSFDLR